MVRMIYLLIVFCINFSANAQSPAFSWANSMGGTDYETLNSMVVDLSSNVYATGWFNGVADFDPGPSNFNLTSMGSSDVFISKFDSLGNSIWIQQIGGSGADFSRKIIFDQTGNIIIIGEFHETVDFDPGPGVYNLTAVSGSVALFILKLNSNGDFVFAKSIGGTNSSSTGVMRDIKIDTGGNIITTGFFSGIVDFDPSLGVFDLSPSGTTYITFISKLDSSGNFVWAKMFDGAFSSNSGFSIIINADNTICIAGQFNSQTDFDPSIGVTYLTPVSASYVDIYIAKLFTDGNLLWVKQIGASLGLSGIGPSMATDVMGNIYLQGYFSGTSDLDPGVGVVSFASFGEYDIFISKLDESGNFIWARQIGGTGHDTGFSMFVDPLGNIYTTGYFDATIDFDPSVAIFNLTPIGGSDGFISKLDNAGSFLWAKQLGGLGLDSGYSIKVDNAYNLYVGGVFQNIVTLDTEGSSLDLICNGSFDVFIGKLHQSIVGINDILPENYISIYPNPSKEIFNVLTSVAFSKDTKIQIYNVLGALVYTQTQVKSQNTIDLIAQPNGIYFAKILAGNKVIAARKIIKE